MSKVLTVGQREQGSEDNMNNRELPERLDRRVIYESDYVCLYTRSNKHCSIQ